MITLVKDYHEADGITHNGTMHDDEVFATAFLSLYFKDFKVARVSEVASDVLASTIIYDIGKGEFDHHQIDSRVRDNGIKYSSFGLIFEKYGLDYLKKIKSPYIEEVYDYFVKDFVEAIDAIDNGIFPIVKAPYKVKMIGDLMKIFNPSYLSSDNADDLFVKAVSIAEVILDLEIKNVIGKVVASKEVKNLLSKCEGPILVLDSYLPYQESLLTLDVSSKIKFVIYPSNRGGYAIKSVPISLVDKNSRVYFPKDWGGLNGMELEKITGIKGSLFCHINRFLMTADTLDTAIKLANKAILKNEKD